jgi:hypothetical protein
MPNNDSIQQTFFSATGDELCGNNAAMELGKIAGQSFLQALLFLADKLVFDHDEMSRAASRQAPSSRINPF